MLPVSTKAKEYAPGDIVPSSLTIPYNTWATFPFLRLPPELRNKIYDLVFPECRVLILGNHPQKELEQQKRRHPNQQPSKPRFRLSCRLLANKDSQLTPVPLDVLEVCRTINEEATAYLYAHTTFRFHSVKTVNKFLNLAPTTGIQNIASMEVVHTGYGEPFYTKDSQWKGKDDEKWSMVCARIARELTALQYLDLDLTLTSWPLQLKTTAPWTHPLLTLRGSGLHRVRIVLRHHMFAENRLMMTARSLENLMMTAKGREQRDVEEALEAVREFEKKEAQKASLPTVQAKKALVIKINPPNVPAGRNNNHQQQGRQTIVSKVKPTTRPVYYQTRGLEQYARVDLNTVGVAFC